MLREQSWKGPLEGNPYVYAVVPGADDMGVKWRKGELQIMGRRQNIGAQCFNGTASGRVEQWLKWSYEGLLFQAAFLSWFQADGKGPRTVSVTKTRALRKIQVDGRGRLAEVPPNSFPDRAVNVELTELRALGNSYSSLGIEAFPDDSNIAAAFYEVTCRFLDRLRGVRIDINNSHSYPSWLSRLIALS